MKKYFFPIAIVILGITLFIGVWYLFFGGNKEKKEIVKSSSLGKEILSEDNKVLETNLVKINKTDALGYFKKDGNLYYFDNLGNLFFYDLDSGQLFQEEGVKFQNLVGFKTSFDKKKLILIWQENGRKKFSLFDLNSKKTTLIPEVEVVNFSLFDSNKGVIFKQEKGKSSLIGEIDFSKNLIRPLYKIDAYDLLVYFPKKDLIVFSDRPSGFVKSSVFFLDLNTGRVKNLLEDELKTSLIEPKGVMIKFFGDKYFLVAIPSLKKLNLFSEDKKLLFNFNFFTFPEKCQKDKNYLICAVPLDVKKGLTLPDDWYQGKLNFPEAIYKINLETGFKEKIYETEISDIVDIEVLSENKISFFDRVTASIYTLVY
ncbi:hypothetical protein J7J41_02335 [bacterium]|nr:hypothetical protein [bacterium]